MGEVGNTVPGTGATVSPPTPGSTQQAPGGGATPSTVSVPAAATPTAGSGAAVTRKAPPGISSKTLAWLQSELDDVNAGRWKPPGRPPPE
jgi:hypothetical protein